MTKNSLENFESCGPGDFGFRDSRSGFGVTLAVQDTGEGIVMGVDCSSVVQSDEVDVGCWFSWSVELHMLGADGACADQEMMMSSNPGQVSMQRVVSETALSISGVMVERHGRERWMSHALATVQTGERCLSSALAGDL